MFPVLSWASDINHTSGQISRESNGNRLRPTFKCGEGAITIDTHPSLLFWRNFRINPHDEYQSRIFLLAKELHSQNVRWVFRTNSGTYCFWFLKTVFYVIFFRSLPPVLPFLFMAMHAYFFFWSEEWIKFGDLFLLAKTVLKMNFLMKWISVMHAK